MFKLKPVLTTLVILLGLSIPSVFPSSSLAQDADQLESDRDIAQAKKTPRKPAKPSARAARAARTKKTTGTQGAKPVAAGTKVAKIVIKGNKKIEVDAVTTRLLTKEGAAFDASRIREDVDALFKTGYFYDVVVSQDITPAGVELTYALTEKPSVVEINFEGNDELETDELREASSLKAYEILNMNKIREASEKLQKLYEEKGFFLAKITPVIDNVTEGESVKLTFKIQENEKVKVKRVTFLGNRNLEDGKLKAVMQTQEGGFFSFMSGSGAYKQDTFDRDVQVIQYRYFNEGYVQVKVDRPQVYVTPDKKGIYITIRIDEGDRFKVGTVDFAGDILFDRDELFNAINIDGSGWYNHETLMKDLQTLQDKYGDLGYAYANIIPRTRTNEREKEVYITFEIDKGNKVYFNRINVTGNSKTRDKVLRRELVIREGELYNATRRRESLENVRRLGFFDEVAFNSSTPGDGADLMDLDIVVKERNTGQIQVGAGYSTYSKFIFNGQVNQINLFGRGQKLGLTVELSSNQSIYNFNFTEPYFNDTKWSVGFDAYQTQRKTVEYTETKKGGAVRVGHPLARFLNGFVRYKFDNTKISLADINSEYYAPELFPVETANGDTSSVTGTLEYDRRDDRFAPQDGVFSSVSLEYAGLGGQKKYTKGFATGRFYKKVLWDIVFRNNLTYGFIASHKENEPPPFNELFLLGGANTLRGYEWYNVGRTRYSETIHRRLCTSSSGTFTGSGDPTVPGNCAGGTGNNDLQKKAATRPFGGRQQIYYNLEFEFPLISEAGIKGVVFYDVGQAEDELSLSSFKMDWGFGFRWFSPLGPLRFEWGFPINPGEDDRAVNFQFAIGTPF